MSYQALVYFLYLADKNYPSKAVGTLKKKKKAFQRFRENLLGSIRPFPDPLQFFVPVPTSPLKVKH